LPATFTTIVTCDALREHLGDRQWVIADCRHSLQDFGLGRRLYEEEHIPGAFFADVEHDLAGKKTGRNGRHPLPDPETFAGFLRTLGVSDETQVVAYDEGADMYAARFWMLCRWIGHDAVAVLDGGISAWRKLGYALDASRVEPRKQGNLTIRLHPELIVTADQILQDLNSGNTMRIIDARAAERFRGDVEPLDPVAGHIPGAENYWFKNNFDGDGRLKSPEELRVAYERYGNVQNVVHQCGSGISSAVNLLAMERAGLRGSHVYAGSWSEWCSDPLRPVSRG
jgi:thiosulfate/3-mercaptopyruvate sulfurtransferase